jgi:hypothetical protein
MSYLRLVFGFCFVAMMTVATPSTAQACSCFPPDLVKLVNDNEQVFRGRILNKKKSGMYRYFQLEIQRTYKGCYTKGDTVILKSPISSATCGQNLKKNRRYLITGWDDTTPNGTPVVSFNICGFNTEFTNVTAVEREFLNSRLVDCPSVYQGCANGAPQASCVIDPCVNAPACSTGTCAANYCGGCNVEYYDASGDAACETDWSVTPPN